MGGRNTAIAGGVIMAVGIIVTVVTMSAAREGGTYIVAWGAIVFGGIMVVRGLMADDYEDVSDDYQEQAAPAYPAPAVTLPVRISGSVSDADYPAEALRAGVEGEVLVSFLIDEAGLPRRVEVNSSSGDDSLDEAACRVVEQSFRYDIPRDANGNPTITTEIERIVWRLPAGAA